MWITITRISAVAVLLAASSAAPAPIKYCSPDAKDVYYRCKCLDYHPEAEFCEDEQAPLPSCCLAADHPKEIKFCSCCKSKYGSKKFNSSAKTYEHIRSETEYSLK